MPEHPTDAHFSFTFVFKQALNNGMNFLTIRILNLTFKDSKKFIPSVYFIYEIKLWVFTYAKVVNPVLTQGKMLTETSNV